MTLELPLPGLPGDLAVHHLATLGIAYLLAPEHATIHYDELTPVLHLQTLPTPLHDTAAEPGPSISKPTDATDATDPVDVVAQVLVERALDAAAHPPTPIQTSSRTDVNAYLRATWADPRPVFGLRIDSEKVADPTKYAQGTRFATAVNHPLATKLKAFLEPGDPQAHYQPLVVELFTSPAAHPTPHEGSLLGLSPTDNSEAVRYAGKTKYLYEAAELLAGSAIPHLAPRATFPDPDHARTHRWLRWHLNTTPMTWHGLTALARRDHVPGLTTYESELKAGSSGKYYRFTPPTQPTTPANRTTP